MCANLVSVDLLNRLQSHTHTDTHTHTHTHTNTHKDQSHSPSFCAYRRVWNWYSFCGVLSHSLIWKLLCLSTKWQLPTWNWRSVKGIHCSCSQDKNTNLKSFISHTLELSHPAFLPLLRLPNFSFLPPIDPPSAAFKAFCKMYLKLFKV